jgi:hypothetical protein
MDTMVDIIFKGEEVRLDLVAFLLNSSNDFYLVINDDDNLFEENLILEQFKNSNAKTLELALSHSNFNFNGNLVPNIYINLEQTGGVSTLLFYFDLVDVFPTDHKKSIDLLWEWSKGFMQKHPFFNVLICQRSEENDSEIYFTEKGIGELYNKLFK